MPTKIVLFGGKMMGTWASICLKIFLQTTIIVKGKENIIKNKKFFIACSHQSMFETFYLQTIFNSPLETTSAPNPLRLIILSISRLQFDFVEKHMIGKNDLKLFLKLFMFSLIFFSE